jgi:hypothetical protein
MDQGFRGRVKAGADDGAGSWGPGAVPCKGSRGVFSGLQRRSGNEATFKVIFCAPTLPAASKAAPSSPGLTNLCNMVRCLLSFMSHLAPRLGIVFTPIRMEYRPSEVVNGVAGLALGTELPPLFRKMLWNLPACADRSRWTPALLHLACHAHLANDFSMPSVFLVSRRCQRVP